MSKGSVVLCVVVLAAMTTCCLALPTADELLKQMGAKAGERKTYEADTKMTSESQMGVMSSVGHFATELTEKDGAKVQKMCNTMDMTVKQDDQEQKMQMKMVNDGEFLWTEMRNPSLPFVQVMKMKPGQTMPGRMAPDPDPTKRMEEMKKTYDLKVVGEETIDGQKMYILEGTLKENAAGPGQAPKVRMYINENDLAMRRVVAFDADGKQIGTMDFTNMKVNQPINADLFKYTPPPGARVMDMTKGFPGMPPMGGAPEAGGE